MRVVFAGNGCMLYLPVQAYRDGDHLAYVIDSAVHPGLRYGPNNQRPAPVAPPRGTGWTVWRVLNALGAVIFGLCTLVIALATVYLDYPVWGWVGGLALTVWCAVDARARGRPLPAQRRVPS